MARRTTFALLGAAIVLLSVMAPVAAASDDGELSVAVDQDDGVTVTVTDNGTAVSGATVEVTAGENESYDGEGTYETGDDGTVSLATPNETVAVTVTATVDNATASTTATLEADSEDDDENETEDGNASSAFGVQLNDFIADTDFANESGPRGLVIADFVVSNNPGNAPDHAGPKNDSERGPPEDAGPPEDTGPDGNETGNQSGSQGPPDHAGNDNGDDEDDEDDEGGGPPDDAGPEAVDPLGL